MNSIKKELVDELLDIDPVSGVCHWKTRARHHFKNDLSHTGWNTRFAGLRADGKRLCGYRKIKIFGRIYAAHRIVWLSVFGEMPGMQIDHINGVKSDNRIVNLRDVSNQANSKNRRIRSDNKSGLPGVRMHKLVGKWETDISIDGTQTILGYYADFFEAVCVRKSAEITHDYHQNHGKLIFFGDLLGEE